MYKAQFDAVLDGNIIKVPDVLLEKFSSNVKVIIINKEDRQEVCFSDLTPTNNFSLNQADVLLASEKVLSRDWLSNVEEEVWRDL